MRAGGAPAGPAEAADASFEPHRPRLTGLAYRMLGSLADAEDAVQEAFLRWSAVDRASVENDAAYLVRVVTRICLDQLKSARARRETYVGPWLPEPVLDTTVVGADEAAEIAEDLSVALLMALERLSPLERAAFLLHDVFDYDFASVGETLGRSPAACRQLAARAREHVRQPRSRYAVASEESARIAVAFRDAVLSGEAKPLAALLAENAVLYADGGGKRAAMTKPVLGRDLISRALSGFTRKAKVMPVYLPTRVNGMPGILVRSQDGTIVQTMALDIVDGQIVGIYVVRNPDKLQHIRPDMV